MPRSTPTVFRPREPSFAIDRAQRRKMKLFARAASHVCGRWHSIAHARSNCHLWVTRISLISLFEDMCVQLARLRTDLSRSNGSDLDVKLIFSSTDRQVTNLMV